MEDLIGRSLGPYQILEQLGQGGMATVFKAYQPAMDRYVAIKVLPRHMADDPQFRARFQREARTIARLEHRYILPVHDTGEQNGIHYMVMRYTDAGTLRDLIGTDSLSIERAVVLVAQVAEALAYAHRQGVIHRDIKPANVLISREGDAQLSDFGIARIIEGTLQLTSEGMLIGTPYYMAPEQVQGRPSDARTDIYALGVVLYEALTGRRPFEAETPLAVALMHLHNPLPPPRQIRPELPEEYERAILRALAKDPDDRFQSADDLARALRTALAAPTATLSPQAAVQPAGPPPRPAGRAAPSPAATVVLRERPRWLWPVVASITVMLVMVIGLLVFLPRLGGVAQPPATTPTPDTSAQTAPDGPALAARDNLQVFSSTSWITGLAPSSSGVWAATYGGLVHWGSDQPQVFTAADGLPFTAINTMLAAPDGALWLAGQNGGLARVTLQDENPAGAAAFSGAEMGIDYVRALAADSAGGILAIGYAESGLVRFDGQTWAPVSPPLNPSLHGDLSGDAGALLVARDGSILLGTEHGLLRLKDGEWTRYGSDQGLGDVSIVALAEDQEGRLYAAARDAGLFRSTDSGAWESVVVAEGQPIFGVAALSDGSIWATSWSLVSRSEDQGDTWALAATTDSNQIRYGPRVVATGGDGAIWVGGQEGLARFNGMRWETKLRQDELPASPFSRFVPHDNLLWLVPSSAFLLASLNPETSEIARMPGDVWGTSLAFTDDTIWVGNNEGMLRRRNDAELYLTEADGLPAGEIRALLPTDEELWIGSGTGLVRYSLDSEEVAPVDEFAGMRISVIFQASDGAIWVGSEPGDSSGSGQIGRYDGSDWQIWSSGSPPLAADGDGVITFAEDGDGKVWVSLWNSDLAYWSEGEWHAVAPSEGAPDETVLSIRAKGDDLWMVGRFDRLYRLNEDGWSQVTIDGLPSEVRDLAITDDGVFWMLTSEGLIRYQP